MKIKKTKVILIFVIFIAIIFSFSYAQEINLQEFTSEYDLMNEITKFANQRKETKDENVLLELNEKFQQESEKLNKEWEEKYFSLVSNIHTSNSNYDRYNSLKNSISYLEKSLKQIDDNITSAKNIYKNRLKAIPTAYLILSKIPITLEEAKADKLRKLMDLTKKYVADNFSTVLVFNETEVKNYRVVKDLIEVIEAGRSESFESDPIWFVTEDNNFYLLQKYRLYPEFPEKSSIKREGELSPSYDGANFYKIENEGDKNLPDRFKKSEIQKQIKNFIKDVSEFNKKKRNKIYEINNEYPKIIDELLAKRTEIKNELILKKEEIRELSKNYTRDFEQELKEAEDALNSHVRSREVLVFTILSELEQTGRSVEDQFKELILQAYNDLINRAKSLKSYKFYRVENHILTSYNAEEFYDKVYPVSYSMPLRRRTYREEEGGLSRLGIFLALKVRLMSKEYYKILERTKQQIQEGENFLLNGDYDKAIDIFYKILSINEDSPEVKEYLPKVKKYLQKAQEMKKEKQKELVFQCLSEAKFKLNKIKTIKDCDEVEDIVYKIFSFEKDNEQAKTILSNVNLKKKNIQDKVSNHIKKAEEYKNSKKYEEALKELGAALTLISLAKDPLNKQVYNRISQVRDLINEREYQKIKRKEEKEKKKKILNKIPY